MNRKKRETENIREKEIIALWFYSFREVAVYKNIGRVINTLRDWNKFDVNCHRNFRNTVLQDLTFNIIFIIIADNVI